MYNSKNSTSSKASFTSAVLAQAKLLGITTPSNELTSLDIQVISDNIIHKIEQKTNVSVNKVPTNYNSKIGGVA